LIAVLSHAVRSFCHLVLVWGAILGYAINLSGAGSAVGVLGLIDAHQLAASMPRGNDVVLVLRHDERHSHRHGTAHRAHGANAADQILAGVGHDEDHIVVLPHTSDSSGHCTGILVQSPQAGGSTAAFEASRVWVPRRAAQIASSFALARSRAGPQTRLRATVLRI
jgi:hypothetical protein